MEFLASDEARWQLELDMEDPAFLMQLEGLLPQTEQNGSMLHFRGLKNSPDLSSLHTTGFQSKELARGGASPISACMSKRTGQMMTGQERPSKISKPNSWGTTNGNYDSQLDLSNSHVQSCPQSFTLQHNSHLPSHLDILYDTLPTLKEGNVNNSAAPPFHVEAGLSQGGGGRALSQDSCISEVHSAGLFSGKDTALSPPVPFWSGFYQTDSKMLGSSKGPPGPPPVNKPSSGHSQDHIMAERKRREKLSQRFIALSAILPSLKKMDKASILGDAIKHVKQLQEKLKELEEQIPKKNCVAISRGERRPASGTVCTSEDGNFGEKPEIEVRMAGKNVLIRVQCEKRKGILVKYLSEIEKLQLTVATANIISFSETSLILTFSAQMEDGFELTAEETLEVLQSFFRKTK